MTRMPTMAMAITVPMDILDPAVMPFSDSQPMFSIIDHLGEAADLLINKPTVPSLCSLQNGLAAVAGAPSISIRSYLGMN
uniref:Uncharacterized protein n=1 Tax=Pristionchus pacificus TaxID=54126 RepID=A0A2A6B8F1_PRIPA|eukprot:PDM62144.1 hypothetical protein PRIPAC_51586 [Pristionchus pacificus]